MLEVNSTCVFACIVLTLVIVSYLRYLMVAYLRYIVHYTYVAATCVAATCVFECVLLVFSMMVMKTPQHK